MSLLATSSGQRKIWTAPKSKAKSGGADSLSDSASTDEDSSDSKRNKSENCLKIWKYDIS